MHITTLNMQNKSIREGSKMTLGAVRPKIKQDTNLSVQK